MHTYILFRKCIDVVVRCWKMFQLFCVTVRTKSVIMMVHVHYFGDKGRHSWVSANCMMQFTSLADFQKLAESLTTDTKKKDPKYVAAFVVKPGIKKKWQNAVKEATETQPLSTEERIAIFMVKFKVQKPKAYSVDEKNKKRKHSRLSLEMEQIEPDVKRTKQENVILKIIIYIYYKFNLMLLYATKIFISTGT